MKYVRGAPERDRGFTLVELLVVTLILGVISSMTVIAIGGVRHTSAVQACSTDWQTFDSALKAYGVDHLSPTTGQPDYSGLSANPLQLLASGDPKYLSNTAVADPTKYAMNVAILAGGAGFTIQVSDRAGAIATTLSDTATPSMAAAACSTAVPA